MRKSTTFFNKIVCFQMFSYLKKGHLKYTKYIVFYIKVTYIIEVNNLTVRVHHNQKTTSRISKSTHGCIRLSALKLINMTCKKDFSKNLHIK
jgi:hypothetical protein